MTKKQTFIKEIQQFIDNGVITLSDDAQTFFAALDISKDNEKPAFTPNGKLVLQFMKDNKDNYNNLFKAKDIGTGLEISSRTASGAMRKLVNDGYAEKVGTDPVIYAITQKGIEVDLNVEEG